MYLNHFGLRCVPFDITPNTDFYCEIKNQEDILHAILHALELGNGFIKVTGEVGSGKTLLCRKLLKQIKQKESNFTCYIPNPDLSPIGLRRAVATELGAHLERDVDSYHLEKIINEELLKKASEGKRVILLVDEAQALSDESLETLRLISNLETETNKLLIIILFAQPELDQRLIQYKMRQLMQRISYSFEMSSLPENEIARYLATRLVVAGHKDGQVFSHQACKLLYTVSSGWPRILNILADKSLLVAYGSQEQRITPKIVFKAIVDSMHIISTSNISTIKRLWLKQKIIFSSSKFWLYTVLFSLIVVFAMVSTISAIFLLHK